MGLGSWYGFYSEERSIEGAGNRPLSLRFLVRRALAGAPAVAATERLNRLRNHAGHTDLTPKERRECWDIVREFTADQVKDYLAELPNSLRERPANFTLGMMLYFRWAQIDPETAANAAERESFYFQSVMTAWMGKDPDAAIRWAAANHVEVGVMAGRLIAMDDPHAALKRSEAVSPVAAQISLVTLAQQMSISEDSRREFFAMAEEKTGTKEWDVALSAMISTCMARDPINTLNHIDQFGLPPNQSERLREQMVKQMVFDSPEVALTWMQQPDAAVPADQQLAVYSEWAQNYPDQASAWAVKYGRPDFLAKAVEAKAAIAVQNEDDYWLGGLKTQFAAWQQQQPDAAGAWLDKMPSSLREKLIIPTIHATH